MTCRLLRLVGFVALVVVQGSLAQEPKALDEIDISKAPRLYGSHFGRDGKSPAKVIRFDNKFVRFTFQSGGKITGSDQHGIYSYFSLVGDFEVSADYDIKTLVVPEKGYGSAIGIFLETDTPAGNVQLMRGYTGDKPPANGYIFTRAIPQESETKYELTVHPSKATRGKLSLKREKDELIYSAADKWTDPLKELGRVTFTKEKILKVRLVADRGGDDNTFDNGIGNFKVQATEITGGLPKGEVEEGTNWIKIASWLVLIGGIVFFVQRWRKGRRE